MRVYISLSFVIQTEGELSGMAIDLWERPKCQKHNLIIKEKMVKCPDEQCNWILFRMICGVQLSIKDLTLLTQNKTSLIKNMKSKNGKKFSAYFVLNHDHKTIFKFLDY